MNHNSILTYKIQFSCLNLGKEANKHKYTYLVNLNHTMNELSVNKEDLNPSYFRSCRVNICLNSFLVVTGWLLPNWTVAKRSVQCSTKYYTFK